MKLAAPGLCKMNSVEWNWEELFMEETQKKPAQSLQKKKPPGNKLLCD